MKISMDKKYRTRDGRDIRLLCVDGPEEYPVIGVIYGKDLADGWDSDGKYFIAGLGNSDLIEYHEPDIRTIWVNVYVSHVEPFQTRNVAELNAAPSCISIAHPVTFEVKRS